MLYSSTHIATVGVKELTARQQNNANSMTYPHVRLIVKRYDMDCKSSRPTWPQRGLKAKMFGLGLVASGLGLVLVLMQCWPRSHEGCRRGLVVSHGNHVIHVTFFSDICTRGTYCVSEG